MYENEVKWLKFICDMKIFVGVLESERKQVILKIKFKVNSYLGLSTRNKMQNAPQNMGVRNVFIQITVFPYIKQRSTNGG